MREATEEDDGYSSEVVRLASKRCKFCDIDLTKLADTGDHRRPPNNGTFEYIESLWMCQTCGWWKAQIIKDEISWGAPVFGATSADVFGSLRNLNLSDITTPIKEVRDFLASNYKARLDVHPRLFEETVVSVFRDLGYKGIATAYRNDDGIDAILHRGSEVIGVQVKRSKGAIGVDQIRELAGALVFSGLTRGMFVTTSRFTAGSKRLAKQSIDIALPIELVDAPRFYDALGIAQRAVRRSIEDIGTDLIQQILGTLEQPPFVETPDGRRFYKAGSYQETAEGTVFILGSY